MTLIAVAPNKFTAGVETLVDERWHTPPSKRTGKTKPVKRVYEVLDLETALAREWRTDAHLVSYIVRDSNGAPMGKQPRVNKEGLAIVERTHRVDISVLVADVDNPEHAEWTDALIERAFDEHATKPILLTAGVYATRGGRRIVQPLAHPLAPLDAERYLEWWFGELEAAGLAVDWSCRDWTRHMRLPHVYRDGRPYRSPWVELGNMRPIEPPKLAPVAEPVRRTRKGEPRPVGPTATPGETPLAIAFERAGWLGPSAGAGRVAVACPWENTHTIGARFDTSTVIFLASPSRPRGWFHCSHGHCVKRTQKEVIEALPPSARAIVEPPKAEPVRCVQVTVSSSPSVAEEASAGIVEAIRTAQDALTVIAAECGLGKSRALEVVAVERERSAARDPEQKRTPKGVKTAISVPTHVLAVQTAENIRRSGAGVLRLFSPFSMKNEDGSHECRYAEAAKHLVGGHQSGQWELCEGRGESPCVFKGSCRAYRGADGPDDAWIVVGPHQLIGQLDAEAGKTGLLGIDEPGSLLETEVFNEEHFANAMQRLGAFGRRYTAAMRPALRALRGYMLEAELDEVCSAIDAVGHGAYHVDELELDKALGETGLEGGSVLDCARAAHYPDKKGGFAPPLERYHVERAKDSPAYAKELGDASKVLWTIYRALTSEGNVSVRIEERADRRHMVITMAADAMVRALRRDGRVVVLDANADTEVLERLVGYAPKVHRFSAPDGALVRRTHIVYRTANKKAWQAHGRLSVSAIVGALTLAVDWILEEPAPIVGIISSMLVRLALEVARGESEDAWKDAGQTEKPAKVRETLAPVLGRLGSAKVLFGHYGALRGLNYMASVDALVTLGDPWTNLADVQNEADFLGLGDRWEARAEMKARAELEQAQGRLRAIHRSKPARALHVGRLLPSGAAWSAGIEVREPRRGARAPPVVMHPPEVERLVDAIGGPAATAKALNCARSTVYRYLAGTRAVPELDAERLRTLAKGFPGTDPLPLGCLRISFKYYLKANPETLSEALAKANSETLSEAA